MLEKEGLRVKWEEWNVDGVGKVWWRRERAFDLTRIEVRVTNEEMERKRKWWRNKGGSGGVPKVEKVERTSRRMRWRKDREPHQKFCMACPVVGGEGKGVEPRPDKRK
ncbi:hypothetical protein Pcinc_034010 [Petrolisthes cinctipes]|uniref:Uncharacterized protein n=1 Tax=Petrolisthes cinctipes TaxID=88211 RepID=A0AAE1K0Q8_PETCI|nr:hypothetical protein Pcinc_034010 [Petrolisthes cinctipes]